MFGTSLSLVPEIEADHPPVVEIYFVYLTLYISTIDVNMVIYELLKCELSCFCF